MKISNLKNIKHQFKKIISKVIVVMMMVSIMQVELVFEPSVASAKTGGNSTKTVTGQVTDYNTKQVIEGVTLTFYGPGNSGDLVTTTSNANGNYTASSVHNGNASVKAHKDGYDDQTLPVKVNQDNLCNIELKKSAPLSKPNLSADTTESTKQVKVTITNWGLATTKNYRINGGSWQIYNTTNNYVTMTANGFIEARGSTTSTNLSEIGSLTVSNIYSGLRPPAPSWVEDQINSISSTVTAIYPSWAKNRQISLNGVNWIIDNGPILLSKDTIVRAKYQDVAGNKSYVGAIDEMNGDWSEKDIAKQDTSEATLMVRSGDIDNFGYTWESEPNHNYNPFSGNSTVVHPYNNWTRPSDEPSGLDKIMEVSSYDSTKGTISSNGYSAKTNKAHTDGYTSSTKGKDNKVESINLNYDLSGVNVKNAILQMFVDDFQAGNSRDVESQVSYQVKINGVRITELEDQINSLDQSGPIGKLISMQIPAAYMDLVKTGSLSINIDDPVIRINGGDGYAIDSVKLLVNPGSLNQTGTINGKITDFTTKGAISNAKVSAGGVVETLTDTSGNYTLKNVPAGLASIKASKSGYEDFIVNNDLVANSTTTLNFQLRSTQKPGIPYISENPITLTNNNVTIGIEYPDTPASKWYSINKNPNDQDKWVPYNGSFTVGSDWAALGDSWTIKAKSTSSTGYISDEANFIVSNIDKSVPNAPVLSSTISTPTNINVLVTATFPTIGVAGNREISIDGGLNYSEYISPITLTNDATVKARYKNAAGTYSLIATLIVNVSPSAPIITGVSNGVTYETPVTPNWLDPAGTTSSATLDDKPYTKGTLISIDGYHTLVVTATKTSNGLKASATVNFTLNVKKPEILNHGIFINGKLLDSPFNVVRGFNLNIGMGFKVYAENSNIRLQLNKDSSGKDVIDITDNKFDLYEVTNTATFTLKPVALGIQGISTANKLGKEYKISIPLENQTGYKYYVLTFKTKIKADAKIQSIINTFKVNTVEESFPINIKNLPILK